MESVVSIIFVILSFFGSFLVVAGIIFLIVKLVKARSIEDKPFKLNISLLFKVYLYLISFVTLVVAVYGGTLLFKAGSSYLLGIPFSYDIYATNETTVIDTTSEYYVPECYDGKATSINNQSVCFDETTRNQDLVNGATFFVSMLLIFGLHQFALHRLEKREITPWLKKAYTFLSLILYSIVGVIIIPTAIYQLSNHLLYRVKDITIYGAPGTAIGLLIMVLPLWIIFLLKTTKMKDDN